MSRLSFVTEPQAIKLKQLGFNWGCRKMHGEFDGYNGFHDFENYNQMNEKNQYSAPETVVALKWLMEEKKIFAQIDLECARYKFNVIVIKWFGINNHIRLHEHQSLGVYDTYESAQSEGLDCAIKYLLEQKNKQP